MALLLSTFSHLRDVLGERGAVSVVRYAASEAMREWKASPEGGMRDPLSLVEEMTSTRLRIVDKSSQRLVVFVERGARPPGRPDPEVGEALLTGYLQGFYAVSASSSPEVVLTSTEPGEAEMSK